MSVKEIIKEISTNPLTDVTFSGGDPFFQAIEVKEVAKAVKSLNKNLWIYTGYTLEEIQNSQSKDMIELLHYGDVLVDGRFEIQKRDLTLPFRGSSNQRIIHLK